MFVLFQGSVRNPNCLEADLPEIITNTTKSLVIGYPLSFLQKGVQLNKLTNKDVLQTEKHVRIALIKAIAHCSHSRVTQKENLLALPTYYIESRDKSKLHFETFILYEFQILKYINIYG